MQTIRLVLGINLLFLGMQNLYAQDISLVKTVDLSNYKLGEIKYATLSLKDTTIFFIDQTVSKLYSWQKDTLLSINTSRCHPGHNFDPFNLSLLKNSDEILVSYSMAGGFWFNNEAGCVGAVSPRNLHSEIVTVLDNACIATFNMRGANPELVLLDKFGGEILKTGPTVVPSFPNTFYGLMHSYMISIDESVFVALSDGLNVYKWDSLGDRIERFNAVLKTDVILKNDMKSNTMDDAKLFRNYVNYYNSTVTPRGLFVISQNHILLKTNIPPDYDKYQYRIVSINQSEFGNSAIIPVSSLQDLNVVATLDNLVLTLHYDVNLNMFFSIYEINL